jgi:hypothetical protein
VEEAAWILRCATHDIPILVANGLLKPLGHPVDNATKFFAYDTLQELKHDIKWLARVTDAVSEHWKLKNARKSENAEQFSSERANSAGGFEKSTVSKSVSKW